MKKEFNISISEEEIMKLLWETNRKMPSKEILDFFNKEYNKNWKKQTLNTFLKRLLQENCIQRISEDRRYLYAPIISKKEYELKKAEQFISSSYNGSFINFICALSGGKLISEEEANDIRKLMKGE